MADSARKLGTGGSESLSHPVCLYLLSTQLCFERTQGTFEHTEYPRKGFLRIEDTQGQTPSQEDFRKNLPGDTQVHETANTDCAFVKEGMSSRASASNARAMPSFSYTYLLYPTML